MKASGTVSVGRGPAGAAGARSAAKVAVGRAAVAGCSAREWPVRARAAPSGP